MLRCLRERFLVCSVDANACAALVAVFPQERALEPARGGWRDQRDGDGCNAQCLPLWHYALHKRSVCALCLVVLACIQTSETSESFHATGAH